MLLAMIKEKKTKRNIFQNKLDITWKSLDKEGNVKVWLSTKNDYSTNGNENYILLTVIQLVILMKLTILAHKFHQILEVVMLP